MLGIANPRAFGKAGQLRKLVAALAEAMRLPDAWQLGITAMLAFVGCVSVPEAVWVKLEHGERLTLDKEVMIQKHLRVRYELLAGFPRLGAVAEAVRYQDRRYDGWDDTGLTYAGAAIPIGARLLKASDYDAAIQRGLGTGAALLDLEFRPHHYDPAVLTALRGIVGRTGPGVLMRTSLGAPRAGMTLKDGLFNRHGVRMTAAPEVTPALLSRIRNMADREPIPVWVA
jgi:HD-GYP domain-containing protein (c-di-GMP phosphodiesterase class II)